MDRFEAEGLGVGEDDDLVGLFPDLESAFDGCSFVSHDGVVIEVGLVKEVEAGLGFLNGVVGLSPVAVHDASGLVEVLGVLGAVGDEEGDVGDRFAEVDLLEAAVPEVDFVLS